MLFLLFYIYISQSQDELYLLTDKPANPTGDELAIARASSSVLNLNKCNINIKLMSLTMLY